MFTALKAKAALNEEIIPFYCALSSLVGNFVINYHYWSLMTDSFEPSLIEINKKFGVLRRKTMSKNYNNLVTELMLDTKNKKIKCSQSDDSIKNFEMTDALFDLLEGDFLSQITDE